MMKPEKPAGSALSRAVLRHLRDPLRLRFAVAGAMLASWYVGFYAPTTERMAATAGRIELERRRAATAGQVEALRERLAPFRDRVHPRAGANELIQYVMARVRSSPMKLVDLKPQKLKELGALQAIGLRLQLEATYEDLDDFLAWAHNDRLLFRVDALRVEPAKAPGRLAVELDLLSLAEGAAGKGKPGGPPRPAAGGGGGAKS
ncbi:hypothetical protein OJF2_44160 [Aquisphaera giovannonii]|uniref:Uncharacterized protein n=1 Tax=Aquisphaera giovannonii TaxID=406548 RepID=A0A5B9W6Q8_9BACT|nr:hypothetical protein [Aquisphaera giovannonii]QEH35859.1 hypothetical protein OJF2_44160 [Aquisphaera giovannonii]